MYLERMLGGCALLLGATLIHTTPVWSNESGRPDAGRKRELAGAVLAAREAATGRALGGRLRSSLEESLVSLPLERLQAFHETGGLGDIEAAVRAVRPLTVGDSAADLVFTPVTPCRIVNTTLAGGPIVAGTQRAFRVTGSAAGVFELQGGNPGGCQIDASATSVTMNFVAVGPTGAGDLRAFPFSASPVVPNASVINYAAVAGLNIANGIAQPICNNATSICTNDLLVQADVSATHLVIDVVGYYRKVDTAQVRTVTNRATTTGSHPAFASCAMYGSVDLTVPAGGSVLVRGDIAVQVVHTTGTTSEVEAYLDTAFDVCDSVAGKMAISVPASAASGTYVMPLSLSRRFSVGPGPKTYYVNTVKISGASVNVLYGSMDTIFTPQ